MQIQLLVQRGLLLTDKQAQIGTAGSLAAQ